MINGINSSEAQQLSYTRFNHYKKLKEIMAIRPTQFKFN